MNRSEAVRYARALLDHPDTDPGIRDFAAAYLALESGETERPPASKDTSLRPRPGESAEDTLARVVAAVRDR